MLLEEIWWAMTDNKIANLKLREHIGSLLDQSELINILEKKFETTLMYLENYESEELINKLLQTKMYIIFKKCVKQLKNIEIED